MRISTPPTLAAAFPRPLMFLVPALVFAGIVSSPSVLGQTFLRGDVNGDGKVSFSDAKASLDFLFRQGPLVQPADASDFDDDGEVNITDALLLLVYAIDRHHTPCQPFPYPGEDLTDDDLARWSYEPEAGTDPPQDPSATLGLVATESDASGRFSLRVTLSSAVPVAGYWARVAISGNVLANGRECEVEDLSDSYDLGFGKASVAGEHLALGYLASMVRDATISAGEEVPVLEITDLCLEPGTPAGEYTLSIQSGELLYPGTGRPLQPALGTTTLTVSQPVSSEDGCPDREDPEQKPECRTPQTPPPDPQELPEPPDARTLDFMRGDANTDSRLSMSDALTIRRWLFNGDRPPTCLDAADVNDSGEINITDFIYLLNHLYLGGAAPPAPYPEAGQDVTTDLMHCHEYTGLEPEETDDTIELGEVEGAPGEDVLVPVYVTNDVEVEAYQLVVAYDPEVFNPMESFSDPDSGDVLLSRFYQGSFYEYLEPPRHNAADFVGVKAYPEDGIIVISFIPNLIETGEETPPGVLQHVFNLPGRIPEGAEPGAVLSLEPTNGPEGEGFGMNGLRNELTYRGEARYVSALPRTVAGILRIIPDVLVFRGDSNGDEIVDISDASFTLSWLFLGGSAPACLDAADADDDGKVNVTDPIATLRTLFLGEALIAPPYPEWGRDPTVDDLGACAH